MTFTFGLAFSASISARGSTITSHSPASSFALRTAASGVMAKISLSIGCLPRKWLAFAL